METNFYEKFKNTNLKISEFQASNKLNKFWDKKNNYKYIFIPLKNTNNDNLDSLYWNLIVINLQDKQMTLYRVLMQEIPAQFLTQSPNKNKSHKKKNNNFMKSLAELLSEPSNNSTTFITDEEITNNKLSASFLSNLNNINEANIAEASQGVGGNNQNNERENLNVHSNASEIDSECDPADWKFEETEIKTEINLDINLENNHSKESICEVNSGVIICKLMDFLSCDENIKPQNSTQLNKIIPNTPQEMKYLRFLIAVELIEGRLLS